jgi:acetylornithine deacetylase/succinyl-diaminopimelate desuccinylase-like protein
LLHLREHGFSDCILELKFLDGVPSSRTPINHPFVKLVEESARDFGKAIVNVSSAGTGPMYYFDKVLGLFVLVVHTNIAELIHQMSLQE